MEVRRWFSEFVTERHPAKDAGGSPLHPFVIENLNSRDGTLPQCVDLRKVLTETLTEREPDLARLRRLLLVLIEDGQRHTRHGHGGPTLGVDPCARRRPHKPSEVICRYGYPRPLVTPQADGGECVREDELQPWLVQSAPASEG